MNFCCPTFTCLAIFIIIILSDLFDTNVIEILFMINFTILRFNIGYCI